MLVAYAAYNPGHGSLYRGIGVVAAFALVVMGDEERAFWTVAGLTRRLFSHCDGQVRFSGGVHVISPSRHRGVTPSGVSFCSWLCCMRLEDFPLE